MVRYPITIPIPLTSSPQQTHLRLRQWSLIRTTTKNLRKDDADRLCNIISDIIALGRGKLCLHI